MLLPRDAGKEKSFPTGPLIKEKKQTVCQSVENKRVVAYLACNMNQLNAISIHWSRVQFRTIKAL